MLRREMLAGRQEAQLFEESCQRRLWRDLHAIMGKSVILWAMYGVLCIFFATM
jgi:hypothetical protein